MVVNVEVDTSELTTENEKPVFIMEALDENNEPIYVGGDGTPQETGSGTPAYLAPAITPSISYESAGNMEEVTDNCGRTEAIKNGTKNWEITVSSEYGLRPEVQRLMVFENLDATPRVTTDLYRGDIEISDITIEQTTNENVATLKSLPSQFPLETDAEGDFEDITVRVYSYQIQLKQPGSGDN